MQLLPNKLYLAMNASFFIAYNGNEETPISGAAIVEYFNLNKRALEPVLQRLSGAEVVISMKGARGGYYMPDPKNTTLRDIVNTFIETVTPDKFENTAYDNILNDGIALGYHAWLEKLDGITFQDLCDTAHDQDIPLLEGSVLNFSI